MLVMSYVSKDFVLEPSHATLRHHFVLCGVNGLPLAHLVQLCCFAVPPRKRFTAQLSSSTAQ